MHSVCTVLSCALFMVSLLLFILFLLCLNKEVRPETSWTQIPCLACTNLARTADSDVYTYSVRIAKPQVHSAVAISGQSPMNFTRCSSLFMPTFRMSIHESVNQSTQMHIGKQCGSHCNAASSQTH